MGVWNVAFCGYGYRHGLGWHVRSVLHCSKLNRLLLGRNRNYSYRCSGSTEDAAPFVLSKTEHEILPVVATVSIMAPTEHLPLALIWYYRDTKTRLSADQLQHLYECNHCLALLGSCQSRSTLQEVEDYQRERWKRAS